MSATTSGPSDQGDRQSEPEGEAGNSDDLRLIEEAKSGNLDAFNQIVSRYQQQIIIHCTGILRDASLAEDVTQETFIRAWRSLSSFHGTSLRAWLMRIATNRCLDILRQRTRQATDSLDAQLTEPTPVWSTQIQDQSPEERSEQIDLARNLERALDNLPDEQRIALLMSDVLGYDYHEIATITGSAIGTVKSRISRARAKLRQDLLAIADAREHFERYSRP